MNRKYGMALLCLAISLCCNAQQFHFQKLKETDSAEIARQIPRLAIEVLEKYHDTGNHQEYFNRVFRLQILAGRYADALISMATLRNKSKDSLLYKQHELFAQAKLKQETSHSFFSEAYRPLFHRVFAGLSSKDAVRFSLLFITRSGINEVKKDFSQSLADAHKNDSLDLK